MCYRSHVFLVELVFWLTHANVIELFFPEPYSHLHGYTLELEKTTRLLVKNLNIYSMLCRS